MFRKNVLGMLKWRRKTFEEYKKERDSVLNYTRNLREEIASMTKEEVREEVEETRVLYKSMIRSGIPINLVMNESVFDEFLEKDPKENLPELPEE